jgi:dinuclear metal center YbgI/SA1388 family protein
MKLESLLQYLDAYLRVSEYPDSQNALNGLQVGGPEDVHHVVAAVDASEAAIDEAAEKGADLLLVHHGLFWDGMRPLTGRRLRKVRPLLEHGIAVYSVHIPLDAHPEVGNCALLARALGVKIQGPFGTHRGVEIGWWGTLSDPVTNEDLKERFAEVLQGPVHLIPGGPERLESVAVVTGMGASSVEEAARRGIDALVTGEGSHHTHFEAMELGVTVLLGGHYATETFGVRALAEHIAERFGLTWEFIDQPTGL